MTPRHSIVTPVPDEWEILRYMLRYEQVAAPDLLNVVAAPPTVTASVIVPVPRIDGTKMLRVLAEYPVRAPSMYPASITLLPISC